MDWYCQLTYNQWKELESQCKTFKETEHGKGTEFYHKSFVLNIADTRIEFHAPLVKARQYEPET